MFLYEKTHRDLKNDYQFFDALKTKDSKIRGNYNLLIKVKFYELEWSFPLKGTIALIFHSKVVFKKLFWLKVFVLKNTLHVLNPLIPRGNKSSHIRQ